MPLQKKDKEFRLLKISYLDFKHTEMDRVLTVLFSRIQHNGRTSRLDRSRPRTIELIRDEFLSHPDWFEGFIQHPDIFKRWLETHLLDLVNRGKPDQALASPRPLHGLTYRFRNPKHCRDYGASQHIYEMLRHARNDKGQSALQRLKTFFFSGIDAVTDRLENGALIDVETQALLRLTHQVEQDAPDYSGDNASYPPLCIGAADLLADDVTRILIYKDNIPRSVMVDYLKIIFSFHLGLYHLKLMKLLPIIVQNERSNISCDKAKCSVISGVSSICHEKCPFDISLLVDVANIPKTHMARLAEQSADFHYRRIPSFLKAYFTLRKLDEFSKHLNQNRQIQESDLSVTELVELQNNKWKKERDLYFYTRRVNLLDIDKDDSVLDHQLDALCQMGLDDFNLYIECIYLLASSVPRKNYITSLDSLLLKNRPGALLAQGRTRGGVRRFILDSRLLEVLLQIAVLQIGGSRGYRTTEIKVEELLSFIRERYGIFIDRLPNGEGFDNPSIEDRESLRSNVEAFKNKLREIGFYQDMSDAFITQYITPRYMIEP